MSWGVKIEAVRAVLTDLLIQTVITVLQGTFLTVIFLIQEEANVTYLTGTLKAINTICLTSLAISLKIPKTWETVYTVTLVLILISLTDTTVWINLSTTYARTLWVQHVMFLTYITLPIFHGMTILNLKSFTGWSFLVKIKSFFA